MSHNPHLIALHSILHHQQGGSVQTYSAYGGRIPVNNIHHGAGFWGSLWGGIKHGLKKVASWILPALTNTAKDTATQLINGAPVKDTLMNGLQQGVNNSYTAIKNNLPANLPSLMSSTSKSAVVAPVVAPKNDTPVVSDVPVSVSDTMTASGLRRRPRFR